MPHSLQWKKFHPLSDQNAFICLVDHMGDDLSIVQAARVSYGKDDNYFIHTDNGTGIPRPQHKQLEQFQKDRQLIRYLMNHSHTTPFEMVEIKFMVQVPMDCWRQWVRHRTASINEYSTRYTEAIDAMQTTLPTEWRLQATDNKQGSSGYLDADLGELITPQEAMDLIFNMDEYMEGSKTPAQHVLSNEERIFHKLARKLYELRLRFGIAKEQARKDLPLSTYTRAYWKCDLHNIFNFLRLRMDSHAQLEIRSFANSMFEIVKGICPVACEAFEDYVLHAKRFSRMEMEVLKEAIGHFSYGKPDPHFFNNDHKPSSMTDREWKEFLTKLQG
jgi:thymidylate synthase (FAD)